MFGDEEPLTRGLTGIKGIQQKITKAAAILVSVFLAGDVTPQTSDKEEFEAAKQAYDQSSHDESARLAYVIKLAKIRDRQIQNYWKTGDNNSDSANAVNEDLQKHPAPANSDSKKLRQLLVGKWESPRHTYVYRANGKRCMEGGPINGSWRINGNQLIQGDLSGPIILLNQDYVIYSSRDSVFFHSRVNE